MKKLKSEYLSSVQENVKVYAKLFPANKIDALTEKDFEILGRNNLIQMEIHFLTKPLNLNWLCIPLIPFSTPPSTTVKSLI